MATERFPPGVPPEIVEAAEKYADSPESSRPAPWNEKKFAFIEGAKWAEKTRWEKAMRKAFPRHEDCDCASCLGPNY